MQTRHFGKLNLEPSLLGVGTMRLPIIGDDSNKIDEEKAIDIIRYAIDHGVNYIDTAHDYHGGMSEIVTGKALRDGYREKVFLATKNPSYMLKSADHWDELLNEQLEKLGTDHIDFYLQHTLDKEYWDNCVKFNVFERAEKAKRDGKIKYYGFSFHDEYNVFEEIINGYDWDFCQIQLNYLDTKHQAGLRGLELAASKGLGVVIMEPLQGGRLANLPDDVKKMFNNVTKDYSSVEWALRFLADRPEVSVVLSGMSTIEQLEDNIKICSQDNMKPGCVSKEDKKVLNDVADYWHKRLNIGCTGCRYCMPCPNGVDIPGTFAAWNKRDTAAAFSREDSIAAYKKLIQSGADATRCIECGTCETACPQQLPIIEKLKLANISLRK